MKKNIIISAVVILIAAAIFYVYQGSKSPSNYVQTDLAKAQEQVKAGDNVTIFYTQEKCDWCKKTDDVLKPLLKENKDITLYVVDVSVKKNRAAWQSEKLAGTPTIIRYGAGKEQERILGFYDKEKYLKLLKKVE
ncbi:thioredoxin family protein [Bacillus mycoides]|uniref:thioredoxin family protein n=1 Tax=Bacillus mycoides TaxID=1405 RepID=UPI0010BE817F|nr:thioredoxin family protein [Bacillus mycoides]TKI46734.1 thioredoxin family protein [Bacillus mycoides]